MDGERDQPDVTFRFKAPEVGTYVIQTYAVVDEAGYGTELVPFTDPTSFASFMESPSTLSSVPLLTVARLNGTSSILRFSRVSCLATLVLGLSLYRGQAPIRDLSGTSSALRRDRLHEQIIAVY